MTHKAEIWHVEVVYDIDIDYGIESRLTKIDRIR